MHIPENYLSPSTCAVMTGFMVPVWAHAIKKVKEEIPKLKMPLLGISAAFSFVGMMFNVPLPGGHYRPCCRRNFNYRYIGASCGMYIDYHCFAVAGTALWGWRNLSPWCQLF